MSVKVGIDSNILYIPPNFLAFHIPLTFALYQLKISKKYAFQLIELKIFCILTLTGII